MFQLPDQNQAAASASLQLFHSEQPAVASMSMQPDHSWQSDAGRSSFSGPRGSQGDVTEQSLPIAYPHEPPPIPWQAIARQGQPQKLSKNDYLMQSINALQGIPTIGLPSASTISANQVNPLHLGNLDYLAGQLPTPTLGLGQHLQNQRSPGSRRLMIALSSDSGQCY